MAGRKSDFTLPTLDDLFSTQELRDDAKLSKIRDIPLELIDDFPDHPFKVRDDEDMIQLVESVKERGVITPATVRQKEDGRYELVSGHRRKRACELAGFETLRSEIVDLNRDEATILMVESNFQRSEILPSEKAFAYKMRLEAMKRQAGRPAPPRSKTRIVSVRIYAFPAKPGCSAPRRRTVRRRLPERPFLLSQLSTAQEAQEGRTSRDPPFAEKYRADTAG